jgi:hypothetical protein
VYRRDRLLDNSGCLCWLDWLNDASPGGVLHGNFVGPAPELLMDKGGRVPMSSLQD